MFKFERLDTLLARIGHLSHKLWPFEFAKSFHVQFRASRYIMRWNRTSEWKVMTIWISRELSLFIFEHIDISWASIIHTSQKLWLLEFAESFLVQFWASWYIVVLNWTSESKFMGIWICLALPCLILSVSIFWGPESNIRVKSYDHLNISRTSVVQFRASGWVMFVNQTSVWKVMINRISRELPLFNFECFDILCPKFGHPCEKLWPFEFLESFRCSILSV